MQVTAVKQQLLVTDFFAPKTQPHLMVFGRAFTKLTAAHPEPQMTTRGFPGAAYKLFLVIV